MAKSITAVTIADPAMGTVSIVSDQVRYTPDAAWYGNAHGTYTMSNGSNTDTARWVIPVTKSGIRATDNTFSAIAQGSGAQDLDVLADDVES